MILAVWMASSRGSRPRPSRSAEMSAASASTASSSISVNSFRTAGFRAGVEPELLVEETEVAARQVGLVLEEGDEIRQPGVWRYIGRRAASPARPPSPADTWL